MCFVPNVYCRSQFSCPARSTARWVTSSRQNLTDPAPVYLYFFNHTIEWVQLLDPTRGCFHGSEVTFVYDYVLALWTQEEQTLAKAFVKYVPVLCPSACMVVGAPHL